MGRSANAGPHPLLEALKKHVELLPLPSQAVVEEYGPAKRDLARNWREVGWPASWMFWERQREERLLDYSTAVALEDRNGWLRPYRERWQGDDATLNQHSVWNRPTSQNRTRADFLQGTTRNSSLSSGGRGLWHVWFEQDRASQRGEAATWRRGLIATIALRAFQLDHGHWPAQIEELVGPYLDSVPVNPWNGEPFELQPQGYPFEIRILDRSISIPAHTPLLLNHGPNSRRIVRIVRPPVAAQDSTTTEWFLSGPTGVQIWPSPKNSDSWTLIAFPLNATE